MTSTTSTTQFTPRTVVCPECGNSTQFSPKNPYRPFCSKRCKLIDFGAWSDEHYRMPATSTLPDNNDACL